MKPCLALCCCAVDEPWKCVRGGGLTPKKGKALDWGRKAIRNFCDRSRCFSFFLALCDLMTLEHYKF